MVLFKYLLLPLFVTSRSSKQSQKLRTEDFVNEPTKGETFRQEYGINCGRAPGKTESSRIINGEVADIKDHPYQVYLSNDIPPHSWLFCGGTIISPRWVVTAAHCKMDDVYIFLKTSTQDPASKGTQEDKDHYETREITKWIIHDDYTGGGANQFDLAVVKTASDIIFDNYAQPACLPLHTFCLNGDLNANGADNVMVTVSGFGTMEGQQISVDTSPVLRRASVPVLSYNGCQEKGYDEGGLHVTYEAEFCAGGSNKDSCTGDSGGPIVWKENDITTVMGVVSWGIGCNEADYPGVYVKLSRFIHWITQNTGVYVDDMDYSLGISNCKFDHKSTARNNAAESTDSPVIDTTESPAADTTSLQVTDTTNLQTEPAITSISETTNLQTEPPMTSLSDANSSEYIPHHSSSYYYPYYSSTHKDGNPLFDEELFDREFLKDPFPKVAIYAYKRCLKVPKSLDPNTDLSFSEVVQMSAKKDKKCRRSFKRTDDGDNPDDWVDDRAVFVYDWEEMLIRAKFVHNGQNKEMCLAVHYSMDQMFYKSPKYNYDDNFDYSKMHKYLYWVQCDPWDKTQYFVMEKDSEYIRPACLLNFCLTYDGGERAKKTDLRITKAKKKCKKMSWN